MTGRADREVGEADNDRVVRLAQGESIVVVLPENATTGFRWHLDRTGEPTLRLIEDVSVPAEGGGIGAGGTRRFRFQAELPGEAELGLKHWRPWEGEASATKRFGVRVEVRRAGG